MFHSLFFSNSYHIEDNYLLGGSWSVPLSFSAFLTSVMFGYKDGLYFGLTLISLFSHCVICLLSMDVNVWLQARIIQLHFQCVLTVTPIMPYLRTPDVFIEDWDGPFALISILALLPIFMHDYLNVCFRESDSYDGRHRFGSTFDWVLLQEDSYPKAAQLHSDSPIEDISNLQGTQLDAVDLDVYCIQE